MQNFGIGKLAQKAGIAPSAIRFYERIGLLPAAKRMNGKRLYDSESLQQLGLIRLAQRAGFTIAEIRTLLHDFPKDTPPSERWQLLSRQKISEVEKLIEQLRGMKVLLEQTLDCSCESLEDCAVEQNSDSSLC
jgi:MerR family transcriptional regulator, redox-sensitive transcriptional activator SoxR